MYNIKRYRVHFGINSTVPIGQAAEFSNKLLCIDCEPQKFLLKTSNHGKFLLQVPTSGIEVVQWQSL